MSPREERGLVIAAMCKLNRTKTGWIVPSQSSGERTYQVDLENQKCTCLDHVEGGHKCKHVWAAEIVWKREYHADGTVTDTKSITLTEKKTYTQDWRAYNRAQATEKKRVQVLLQDLLSDIAEPERTCTKGPRPHLVKDQIFAMVFKVYCGFSSRRFGTDLSEAYEQGYMPRPVSAGKLTQFFLKPELTPILTELVAKSAAPLAAVETEFAVDSSGFSSNKFERWFDHKYGVTRNRCVWVKIHAACGVKTNCITAVRILDKSAADAPQFKPLVQETARRFMVKEVSGDKAYASNENFEAVHDVGGTAFMAFKSSATGQCGGLFQKMFHYFQFQREEYLAHYHKRSNIEAAFSALKRKFGDSVRNKNEVAMVNEVLCKLIAHNLCCLIQEQEELGIVPVFWKEGKHADVLPMIG